MRVGTTQAAPILDAKDDRRESTILVVEASASVGLELVEQLRADRYKVALARTAEHAQSLARRESVRAVALGCLDAPGGSLDLLEEIRRPTQESPSASIWDERLPLIVLSSGSGQLDLLRAFEMGADDYVTRIGRAGWAGPSYLELRARLRALLRRAERPAGIQLCIGQLRIETGARAVHVAETPVQLCRLEYELLVHLARSPTAVHSKQELLLTIWHQRAIAGARTVDSHASRLRRKLETAGARGLVVNVWGVGYRLV